MRTTRSLREVEALAPGDLIGFEPSDLAGVRLESPSGDTVLKGRLGQIAGQRALRVVGEAADALPPLGPGAIDIQHDQSGATEVPSETAASAPDDLGIDLPDAPPAAPMDMRLPDASTDADAPAPLDAAPAPLEFAPRTAPIDPGTLPE